MAFETIRESGRRNENHDDGAGETFDTPEDILVLPKQEYLQ
jgi:hypothetical protein